MKREDAIDYLERKDKIQERELKEPKYTKEEEEEIDKVMKEGKIYGDPKAEIQW